LPPVSGDLIDLTLQKVAANTEPDDSERQTDVSSFSQMWWWPLEWSATVSAALFSECKRGRLRSSQSRFRQSDETANERKAQSL